MCLNRSRVLGPFSDLRVRGFKTYTLKGLGHIRLSMKLQKVLACRA